ncbi:DUF2500 domain-containing protein [Tepidibacter hydrothermalis]|uniref:DUF2500 domain-containing protein n=1 Tax=Tepidibacter hydrothermalis TaxID=3036126 RepID=A0ABY8E7F6_9FIRM|nr:DUF2500 domain-containing protein [Tepidibacter hydrothermalis]WFD08776.1 DUF2500 domain-containing protein [Tepidibacter hydrothermalis]
MSSWKITLILIMFMWPAILFIGVMIFLEIRKIRKHKKQPTQTIAATLISKEMIPTSTGGLKSGTVVHIHHYMKFKLENGEEKEFEVLPEQYAVILEGNIGELTFKGDKYLSFYITNINVNREN